MKLQNITLFQKLTKLKGKMEIELTEIPPTLFSKTLFGQEKTEHFKLNNITQAK
jgi:hypothetical protein